jgi:hypothetical protein
MTSSPAGRGSSLTLASLTGVLVLADACLAALGLLVWNAQRTGGLTDPEARIVVLLGASAAAGAGLLLLCLAALARGGRGHGLARFASGLAWCRLATVIIAPVAVALSLGLSAVSGLPEAVGAAVAVLDALLALIVAGAAARRTRPW